MADSPATVRRDFRGTKGAVDDADPVSTKTGVKSTPVRRSNGVTTSQALKSERVAKADEGTRSFGAPLGTESERQKQGQSTDSNQ
jgi:hypothetical protein